MKKPLMIVPLALLGASAAVLAEDAVQHQVTVVATVPTENFYVVPPAGDRWLSEPQELFWNPQTNSLGSVRKQLEAKSTIGPIKAYLSEPAMMSSGANTIDLNVSMRSVELTTTATEVMPAALALAGTRMDVVISAKPLASGNYVPGRYQGVVGMIFETAAPPAPPATGD